MLCDWILFYLAGSPSESDPRSSPHRGLLVAEVAVTLGVGHSLVTSFGADAPREGAAQSLETTAVYDAMDLKRT